jgi:hypothetical protein
VKIQKEKKNQDTLFAPQRKAIAAKPSSNLAHHQADNEAVKKIHDDGPAQPATGPTHESSLSPIRNQQPQSANVNHVA